MRVAFVALVRYNMYNNKIDWGGSKQRKDNIANDSRSNRFILKFSGDRQNCQCEFVNYRVYSEHKIVLDDDDDRVTHAWSRIMFAFPFIVQFKQEKRMK